MKLCPFGRHSALSATVSQRAVCMAAAELKRRVDIFKEDFISHFNFQMQNSWFNILDSAIPSVLEDMPICSDSSTIQHVCEGLGKQQLPGCVWKCCFSSVYGKLL